MDKIVGRFKKCKNGHYYDKDLDKCPYCPSPDANIPEGSDYDRTIADVGRANAKASSSPNPNLEKTQIFDTNNESEISSDKTSVFNDQKAHDHSTLNSPAPVDFSKTIIIDNEPNSNSRSSKPEEHIIRKLVGWLISYTIDEKGVDFKLYEGRNTIGKLPSNNICIPNDNSISGHHLTILFRNNKFKIRDELSTNGTIVNGNEVETSQIFEIKDGDTILIGNTTFIFKTPFSNNK